MKKLFFEDYIDDEKYGGVLYGLGISWTPQYNSVKSSDMSDALLLNSLDNDRDTHHALPPLHQHHHGHHHLPPTSHGLTYMYSGNGMHSMAGLSGDGSGRHDVLH